MKSELEVTEMLSLKISLREDSIDQNIRKDLDLQIAILKWILDLVEK